LGWENPLEPFSLFPLAFVLVFVLVPVFVPVFVPIPVFANLPTLNGEFYYFGWIMVLLIMTMMIDGNRICDISPCEPSTL
jgi:hypothetical protein